MDNEDKSSGALKKRGGLDLLYDWFKSKAHDADGDDDEVELTITLPKLRKLISIVCEVVDRGEDLGDTLAKLWKIVDRII